jgi:hypothetical protein
VHNQEHIQFHRKAETNIHNMKTRSKRTTKATTSKKETPEQSTSTAKDLAPSVTTPPHVFVLPKGASSEARIITLPDPASSSPNRYFVCPEKGFYEFTKIAAPKKACRSWLLAAQRSDSTKKEDGSKDEDSHEQGDEAYVLEQPDMFVATPIDPLFVLLPLLVGGETGSYLTFSDYVFTTEKEGLAQLQQLLRQNTFANLEKTIEGRIGAVCDCLDMGNGDDKMYQMSTSKLAAVLVAKAKNMVKKGLPASMEERFVKQALEVPVLSIRREESSVSIAPEDATPGAEGETTETSQESSTSSLTATTTTATVSTAASSIATTPAEFQPLAASDITNLLRVRTGLDFLIASYVPTTLRTAVQDACKSPASPVDFAPLDKHLEHVAGLKKQAQVLRSLSDNISRKRGADDDEDALDKAEAKRKKKEEDEIKKKNTSRGVQQLAKANTTGMKKLSSFFTKAPPKKKA